MKKPARLGEILLRRGLLRHDQLHFLLDIQKSYHEVNRAIPLGDLLVAHRVVTSLAVTEALFVQEENAPESLEEFMSAIRFFPS